MIIKYWYWYLLSVSTALIIFYLPRSRLLLSVLNSVHVYKNNTSVSQSNKLRTAAAKNVPAIPAHSTQTY